MGRICGHTILTSNLIFIVVILIIKDTAIWMFTVTLITPEHKNKLCASSDYKLLLLLLLWYRGWQIIIYKNALLKIKQTSKIISGFDFYRNVKSWNYWNPYYFLDLVNNGHSRKVMTEYEFWYLSKIKPCG